MLLAATGGKALWYATRGFGVVSLLMLTASVVLGIMTRNRHEGREWPRFVVAAMHRNVSLLVVVFVALHVVTTVQDAFAPIHYLDAIIPFASPYRTAWLGFGTVAVDLLLALTITSLLRARIGYRAWQLVHWTSYACWPVAFVHALGTGSDTRALWSIVLDAAVLLAVVGAVVWRFIVLRREGGRVPPGIVALAVVVPVGLVFWAHRGPMQPGWGRRHKVVAAAPIVPRPQTTETTAPAPAEAQGFDGELRAVRVAGAVDATGRRTVSIRGTVHSDPALSFDLALRGPASGSGVSLETGTLTLGPAGDTQHWTGAVQNLTGSHVDAQVHDASGHLLAVSADLVIDRAIGSVGGTVHGTPAEGTR